MQIKSWRFSLIYLLLLILYIFFTQALQAYLHEYYALNFGPNYYYFLIYYLLPIIINAILGILLGGINFVLEIKKIGSWLIDYQKLICMGIFSLFIIIYPFIYFTCGLHLLPSAISDLIISSKSNVTTYTEVIFGFIIVTSFYKGNNESKEE